MHLKVGTASPTS